MSSKIRTYPFLLGQDLWRTVPMKKVGPSGELIMKQCPPLGFRVYTRKKTGLAAEESVTLHTEQIRVREQWISFLVLL